MGRRGLRVSCSLAADWALSLRRRSSLLVLRLVPDADAESELVDERVPSPSAAYRFEWQLLRDDDALIGRPLAGATPLERTDDTADSSLASAATSKHAPGSAELQSQNLKKIPLNFN